METTRALGECTVRQNFSTAYRASRWQRIAFTAAILFPLTVCSASAQSTERVSLSTGGGEANDFSLNASASADGNLVAFYAGASNLVTGDTNGEPDIISDGGTALSDT